MRHLLIPTVLLPLLAVGCNPKGSNLLTAETTVAASGYESKAHGGRGDFSPQNTLDGKLEPNSSWRAESKDPQSPAWITYDLGRPHTITAVRLAFLKSTERKYEIEVSGSLDGKTFRLIHRAQSSSKPGFEDFPGNNAVARYIRITGHGNSNAKFGHWTNILETEIWGY